VRARADSTNNPKKFFDAVFARSGARFDSDHALSARKKNVRRRAPLDFISRKKSAIHKCFLHFVKKYSEKSR